MGGGHLPRIMEGLNTTGRIRTQRVEGRQWTSFSLLRLQQYIYLAFRKHYTKRIGCMEPFSSQTQDSIARGDMPTPPSQITRDVLLKCKIQSLLWTGDFLPLHCLATFLWLPVAGRTSRASHHRQGTTVHTCLARLCPAHPSGPRPFIISY